VSTVGRALVLVTATTVIGFLANLVSPVPPIRDFAVFVAAGITAAMVVMGVLVPASRSLVDRRRGSGSEGRAHVPGRLVAAMSAVAGLAARAPAAVLAACLVAGGAGFVAALGLDTEFSQEAFIPDDADAAEVLDVTVARFGGDVSQQTFVVVDGDLTDPAVANAVLEVSDRLADVVHVEVADGQASVQSAPGTARQVATLAGALGGPGGDGGDSDLADVVDQLEALGWEGDRFAPDADVAAAYDLLDGVAPIDRYLAGGGDAGLLVIDTLAGEDEAQELASGIETALAPLRDAGAEAGVTSQELLGDETLEALTGSQLQKILFTVSAATLLLVLYFGVRRRRPLLGVITLVPTLVALPVVLGLMRVLGLSFNALTATITSIAIGFGVDYGIHMSNRFLEDRERTSDAAEAVRDTVTHTGAALVASATTTAAAFCVLLLSDLVPLRQFGGVTAMTMVAALIATLLAETSCLVLWDRWHTRRGRRSGGEGEPPRPDVDAHHTDGRDGDDGRRGHGSHRDVAEGAGSRR
jgi:uncharacterized protein